MDFDLVIFDCDGVLVDSEMISARVFSEVIQGAGIDMSPEEVFTTFKGGSMGASLAYVEDILGGPASFDIEKEYRSACDVAFRNEMRPVAGIQEVLSTVKVSKCVGSNGPRSKINLNLHLTGLDRFFEDKAIFSAYDFQKWKPDPTMFLEAAKSFRCPPNRCLVVGDSIADVNAATAAGLTCYSYAPHGDMEGLESAGGIVFESMFDLSF